MALGFANVISAGLRSELWDGRNNRGAPAPDYEACSLFIRGSANCEDSPRRSGAPRGKGLLPLGREPLGVDSRVEHEAHQALRRCGPQDRGRLLMAVRRIAMAHAPTSARGVTTSVTLVDRQNCFAVPFLKPP